ncbi:UDP-glucose 4-epimerase GalE [Amylibacter sp.]|nr:UDP-glucose 4-epimerase GalE [Amylibacter sp.]
MKVLVTGGAGYIGSHTCLELLTAGHEVFVVDNLSNGNIEAIDRVRMITGQPLGFLKADIIDGEILDTIFTEFAPDAVIHFAGLKAVSESIADPLKYYNINLNGSITLLAAMDRAGCNNIVFSSSATVYGSPHYLPYDEFHPTEPVNPYGFSKLMVEQIMKDWITKDPLRRATSLRYFNPVGAHFSNLIGEDPSGEPNNLMPYIAQVGIKRLEILTVFGNDYKTHDGTGIRDYVHVVDLALAHLITIEKQVSLEPFEIINLGSGEPTSVLSLIKTFEIVSGAKIPFKVLGRREGDLPESWADPKKAYEKLGWKTELTISDMCRDTWLWQQNNPNGFSI